MKLPQQLLNSQFFMFSQADEFLSAMRGQVLQNEIEEIENICALNLPPVTSNESLAVMLGVNPGLIWSFIKRTDRHYRVFSIEKGKKIRTIQAPKVALKIVQKWLSVHISKNFTPLPHVFGFVEKKSHIEAAAVHCNSKWIYSVDIRNFFNTTPEKEVFNSIKSLGYNDKSASIIASIACYRGYLAQGSPCSPVLSNMTFHNIDNRLENISQIFDVRLTRYADDIVFSGVNSFPEMLPGVIESLFNDLPWSLASEKTERLELPRRLKVHGLLVHGNKIRLTKGYRNKIRAFKHILNSEKVNPADKIRLIGHVNYHSQVEKVAHGTNPNHEFLF